jgi:heme a synthase
MPGIVVLFLPTRARPLSGVLAADAQIAPKAVAVWLFACCGLIFLMVVVGGITRLTLSGLSITEWNPVVGIIPPLTYPQWLDAFARYQQVPEYQALHYGMSLADFQTIFFWEYAHRLLGRLIGVAFAAPLTWFWVRRRLPRRVAPALLGILALGFAQGLLGWYMVESGLADRLEVSQYRLVAHLVLALAIYSLILWTALGLQRGAVSGEHDDGSLPDHSRSSSPGFHRSPADYPRRQAGLKPPFSASHPPATRAPPSPRSRGEGRGEGPTPVTDTGESPWDAVAAGWRRAAEAVVVLVAATIAAGGFVAGTRAGLTYNTFPLMDGRLLPAGYAQLHPFLRNWFESIPAIQFDHRLLAMTTFAAISLLAAAGLRRPLPRPARSALLALLAIAAIQIALGISTLLLVVPVPLAALHQAGAVLLLTAAIVLRHALRAPPVIDAKAPATI